jgi:hypothetical protein
MNRTRSYTDIPLPTDPIGGGPTGGGGTTTPPPTTTPTTPTPGTITIQDTQAGTSPPAMALSPGGWSQYLDIHYSVAASSFVDIYFTGTAIDIWAAKDPAFGIAGAKVDAGAEQLVDLYSPTQTNGQNAVKVLSITGLSAGNHVLRWRKTGTKNAAASFADISIDRAVVTP